MWILGGKKRPTKTTINEEDKYFTEQYGSTEYSDPQTKLTEFMLDGGGRWQVEKNTIS